MKKLCKKIVQFLLSKFSKKMSKIDLLKQHAKTMGIFYEGMINTFGKDDFENIQLIEKHDKYLDFSIAGERFVVKAEMNYSNPAGTKFAIFFNDVNHDNYPTRKIELLDKFNFESQKGDEFKFTNAQLDENNKYLSLDIFIRILLLNIVEYISSPTKANFTLYFNYK